MMVSHLLLMALNLLLWGCTVDFVHGKKGHPSKNTQPDFYIPDNWGHFLLYEGCFELSGTPAKERTDPQNNNNVCSDFCDSEEKKYSATIGERCLCFSTRPTGSLPKDQCKTECPNPTQTDGGSCKEIDCCGSVANNAVTVIQTIRIVPYRHNIDNKDRHSADHVTSSRDGFGNFIVHEGCFAMSGTNPTESRNYPKNTNHDCISYCVQQGITYAASISDRCLCLNNLPSVKVADDQCDTPCPGNVFEEGEACVGFGCCGSVDNSALSIYQSVSTSRDKSVKKLSMKKKLE